MTPAWYISRQISVLSRHLACHCGGHFDYVYGCWWRCRDCAGWMVKFAHQEAKVNIEIDGSSHKHRQELDTKRDELLRNLSWRVIRIRTW